jgi:hypothetical protein
MRSTRAIPTAVALCLVGASPSSAQALAGLDTAAIEQATGLKGQAFAEENVFKVTKPRADLKIVVDRWTMPPFMGLGSWAAFTPAHGSAMMMATPSSSRTRSILP